MNGCGIYLNIIRNRLKFIKNVLKFSLVLKCLINLMMGEFYLSFIGQPLRVSKTQLRSNSLNILLEVILLFLLSCLLEIPLKPVTRQEDFEPTFKK